MTSKPAILKNKQNIGAEKARGWMLRVIGQDQPLLARKTSKSTTRAVRKNGDTR